MAKISIREAEQGDIESVARVHITSWRETYPGVMPQAKIDSLSLERSIRNWQNTLAVDNWFYVAELDGELCGFISGGINRSNEGCSTGLADACTAELAAMYILKQHHAKGIGRALYNVFSEKVKSMGHTSMVAWVAEQNPACGFYLRMGGELVDSRIMMVMDSSVPLVAYRFRL